LFVGFSFEGFSFVWLLFVGYLLGGLLLLDYCLLGWVLRAVLRLYDERHESDVAFLIFKPPDKLVGSE
jgi:hypothetical protein